MEQRGKGKAAVVVVAALVALAFLLFRGKAGGTGGAVTPGGSISSVGVTQGGNVALGSGHRRGWRRGATGSMGSHLLIKSVGNTVTVTVGWTAATKNSSGQYISWNYGISWRYRHFLTGTLLYGGFFDIGSRFRGSFVFTAAPLTLSAPFSGKDWDVQVALHADRSSPTGVPLGDMPALEGDALLIANGQHLNAFRVA